MISLSRARRSIYVVLGLPALFLSLWAPVSIYVGSWAYLTGSDTSVYSLLWFVLAPLLGILATGSGLILIAGRGGSSKRSRITHTALLCLGIAVVLHFAWPAGDIGFRLFVLSPVVVAALLIHHLWTATQPVAPAERPDKAQAVR